MRGAGITVAGLFAIATGMSLATVSLAGQTAPGAKA